MLRSLSCTAVLFVFILFIAASCLYEPENVNPVEVDDTPRSQLDLNDLGEDDTLFIFRNTHIRFDLDVQQGRFHEFKVFIADEEVYRSLSSEGIFYLHPNQFPTGIYPMRYEIYTSTGTNSLADKVGVEQLFYQKEIKVIFDQDLVRKPPMLSLEKNEKGHMVVKWNKEKSYFFDKYQLRITRRPLASRQTAHVHEITSPNDTVFVDSLYFGGTSTYELAWESKTGERSGFTEMSFTEELPTIQSFKTVEGHKLQINWSKTAYPSLFASYTLKVKDSEVILGQTLDPADTFCIIERPMNFGGDLEVTLLTSPKGEDEDKTQYRTDFSVYFGEKTPFREGLLPDGKGYYYTSYNGYLFKLNQQLQPVDSLAGINLDYRAPVSTLSHDGAYLYYYFNSLNAPEIKVINTQNLQVEKSINIQKLFPDAQNFRIDFIGPQEQHDLYLNYRLAGSFSYKLGYYNLQEDTLYELGQTTDFDYATFGGTPHKTVLSSYSSTTGFNLAGASTPSQQQLKDYSCYTFPIPSQPDRFGLVDDLNLKLEIYGFNDFEKIREISLPGKAYALRYSNVDDVLALATQRERKNLLYLIDFETGQTLLELDLFETEYASRPHTVYFMDGWLYASSGYKIDVRKLLP